MAQETWALKLDLDLKEKVQEIIKNDFESSKDFLEQLVLLYELDKLKEDGNVLASEVAELETLTRRINTIFINANGKINTMLLDKDQKAAQQTELKVKLIERLQGDIASLEKEKEQFANANDQLVNLNSEYTEQVNQLTKSNLTLEELVAEYRTKNNTLTGTLTEYKQDREENKLLQVQIKELTAELNSLKLALSESKQNEQYALDNARDQAERYESKVQDLVHHHTTELLNQDKQAEMDLNMRILSLQQEQQLKAQAIQDKHNEEISAYQAKYKELLEQHQKTQSMQAKTNEEVTLYQAKYKDLLEDYQRLQSIEAKYNDLVLKTNSHKENG